MSNLDKATGGDYTLKIDLDYLFSDKTLEAREMAFRETQLVIHDLMEVGNAYMNEGYDLPVEFREMILSRAYSAAFLIFVDALQRHKIRGLKGES